MPDNTNALERAMELAEKYAARHHDFRRHACYETDHDRQVFRAALESHLRSILAENEALRKDAERYRTLRHSLSNEPGCSHTDMPKVSVPFSLCATYMPIGLDRALDVIIAERALQRMADDAHNMGLEY